MSDFGYGCAATASPLPVGHDSYSQSSGQSNASIFYSSSESNCSVNDGNKILQSAIEDVQDISNEDKSNKSSSLNNLQSINDGNRSINNNNIEDMNKRKIAKNEELEKIDGKTSIGNSSTGHSNSGNDSPPTCGSSTSNNINCEISTSQSGTNLSQSQTESSSVISNTPHSFWSTNCGSENDVNSLFHGVNAASSDGTLSFPNFTSNLNSSLPSNSMVPQLSTIPQQSQQPASAQRRAITGAHNFSQQPTSPRQPQSSSLFKSNFNSNWSAAQSPNSSWSSSGSQSQNSGNPWSTMSNQMANPKRAVAVPSISPMKKSPPSIGQSSSMMISPKFRRSTSMPIGKPFPSNITSGNGAFDMTSAGSDTSSTSGDSATLRDGNMMIPFQVRQFHNI